MTTTTNLGMEHVPSNSLQPSVPINAALEKLDAAIAGSTSIEFTADADLTLTDAQVLTSVLELTDSPATLTTARAVIFPAHFPLMWVKNSTAQSLTLKKAGQTGFVVEAGANCMVASGLTDVVRASLGSAGAVTSVNGQAGAVSVPVPICIACSDETTPLTAGTAKVTFRMPFAMTLSAVRASLTTPQASGSAFTVDINENGTSILSTKLTIDNGEKTSTTAATPAVLADTTLADDAEITIDIDQIGDGTAKGLKVYLIGVPA